MMSSLLTVMTDSVSSIRQSDATPTQRRKMKRSVAPINQMKESVALENRRQIDAKSVSWNNRKPKIDVKIDVKIGTKSTPNRRQIDEIRKS